ncbi:hypothetical protein RRG08_037096 [Elysia crispata]|uniref:Uncharacterized protein n=1 Tax=Elysia crispata TaxID=231223 RepID=A0AAE1CSM7_9GAST|nr:hypothetical protein RRG08_037096 [Elysia crispata]
MRLSSHGRILSDEPSEPLETSRALSYRLPRAHNSQLFLPCPFPTSQRKLCFNLDCFPPTYIPFSRTIHPLPGTILAGSWLSIPSPFLLLISGLRVAFLHNNSAVMLGGT